MEFLETLVHYAIIIGEVALALGLVIFVHELGHFVVAKLCGVKCEKFYLGFDVYGLKLCKFQWGETEYGIGALPLGGYVKMLGQDDNPAKAYEEMQRAKLAAGGGTGGDGATAATAADAATSDEAVTLDPRSYMAQSVPKRMAIISAGVVMNLIFAFLFAVLAYEVGVQDSPTIISGVVSGQPAWRAGLEPGDKIVKVGETPTPYFSDLTQAVMLGDFSDGLQLGIERAGREPFSVTVMPDDKLRKVPSIGVQGPSTTRLSKLDRWSKARPVRAGSAASAAEPPFEPEDEIVAIGDVPIESYADLARELARRADQPLSVQVRRATKAESAADRKSATDDSGTLVKIEVPAAPVLDFGLAMQAGPISAIQQGSPAEGKLQVGDELLAIDGQPIADPMRVPAQLNRRAGEKVTIRVRRGGVEEPLDLELVLRAPLDYEWPDMPGLGLPLSVPAAGFAYPVGNVVAAVAPGSPGDAMLIKPGDEITGVAITAAAEPSAWSWRKPQPDRFPLAADKPNWPVVLGLLQRLPQGSKITLTVARDGADPREVAIAPVAAADWFNPDRGFNTTPDLVTHRAASLGEAMRLGFAKTKDNVLLVYRFLRKLKEGQVPVAAIGGPVEIAKQAGASASAGLSHLLIFLVMLSANLAVINFLPIPLLDGGHMVFLTLEAIRRKPVSERVVVAFHYAGFVFLLSLMCFVLFLDLGGRAWLWKP